VSILIVGGGDIGAILAERLAAEGKDVVIVESNEARVRELREALDVAVVLGSASNPKVLEEAGLSEADMLIAVTDSDEVNLISCMIASKRAVIPTKIARVRQPELAEVINEVLADDPLDLNINPEEEAAQIITNVLGAPGASSVHEFASGKVRVVGFALAEGCEAEGIALLDLKQKLAIDCNVVAISRDGELLIPDGRARIERRDFVYAAGKPESLTALAELFGKQSNEVRRIVISGGGNVAYYTARLLEAQGLAPKIIEPDSERCKFLVESLSRSVVIHGLGTDQELLREENVRSADAFLALTRDEEDNVLSALLAKRAGAGKVIALVNKIPYAQLVSAIGVDAVVSPNLAAVSAILQFIRRGKVISVAMVGFETAEALEIVALETSELVGKPLREARLQDAIVGAIARGDEVLIPGGDDVIEPGDHVVLFALRSAIPDLERKMMVKLQYF
jgi:trk system potassium uptake protein TrkA